MLLDILNNEKSIYLYIHEKHLRIDACICRQMLAYICRCRRLTAQQLVNLEFTMRISRLLCAVPLLLLITLNVIAQPKERSKFADILFPATNQLMNLKLKPLSSAEIIALDGNIEIPIDPHRQEKSFAEQMKSFAIVSIKQLFEGARKKDDNPDWYLNQLLFNKFDLGMGREGIICSSYFGSEEMHNAIWMKQGNYYKFSGQLIGKIIKIFRDTNKQPFTIVTISGWCCASGIGAFNLYNPTNHSGVISYELTQSIQDHASIKMPEGRMKPKRFQVVEQLYRLRESPEIEDKPYMNEFEGDEVIGNVLAEFKKGDKGMAIAEKADNTGKIWWFVIMEPTAEQTYSRFYDNKSQYTMGWMSSRYLKVINE